MAETTKEQLVTAAAALLDHGGAEAVTLRRVAEKVGVSHNAPYRHFRSRSALLAAVAERDFHGLHHAFDQAGARQDAAQALQGAAAALIDYARQHPARYHLLFSDPGLEPEAELRSAALASFKAFTAVVVRSRGEGLLPSADPVALTGLIYAALHGAIDLELGGRGGEAKGLSNVHTTAALLFDLLGKVNR